MEVVVHDAPRMPLLGLMLANRLRAVSAAQAADLTTVVAVRAGGMAVTLRFAEGRAEVYGGVGTHGGPSPAVVEVAGELSAFLAVMRGASPVGPWLSGRLSFAGNPLPLLKLLPVLSVEASPTAT